jgi:hypothetical protein
MSTANVATFACESCGKSYRWRPDFAGKKLKCGCGNVMHLTTPPPPPPPPADEIYSDVADTPLTPAPRRGAPPAPAAADGACPECSSPVAPGAALCVNCGFNLRTGAKVETQVLSGAPKTGAPKTGKKKKKAAPKGPGMGKGEFTSFAQRRILADDPEEVAAKARWNDLYWPTIALAVGLVLSIVDGVWGPGSSDWKYVVTSVMVTGLINVVFSFIGVLITSKLLSIGLGNFQTALLKVSAIALAPGAISDIIINKMPSGWAIGWVVSIVLYVGMFNKFFDMDMMETMICAAIIWVMRTWVAYFVIALILAGIGFARFGGGDDGDFGDDGSSKSTKPKKSPQKMKQKAPKDDSSDAGAMVYPIGDRAMVVFFDPRHQRTYHLGAGAVPA